MSETRFKIGDPVIVKTYVLDGEKIGIPATVTFCDERQVCVAFADGLRRAFPALDKQVVDDRKLTPRAT
jgi:hypothetical protein